jgi:hypothetical protein
MHLPLLTTLRLAELDDEELAALGLEQRPKPQIPNEGSPELAPDEGENG